MKTHHRSTCLACGLLLLSSGVIQAQSVSATAALWGAPRLSVTRYADTPPGLTNVIVDSGTLAIGRCRANALMDGTIGIDVGMTTDVNRGLDVYSSANAGLSDRFLLQLNDASVYSVADSTVIHLKVHGSMRIPPPSGYAELKIMFSYLRNSSWDFEYGLLVLHGEGGQAVWTARNDTVWYPGKTNLFLHRANQGLYPINQSASFNVTYDIDRPFYVVLPKMGPQDISGQELGFSIYGTVSASGGSVAFYNTAKMDRLNPISFLNSVTSVDVPLQSGDQFSSQAGMLTSTNWSYPVILKPVLAIRNMDSQVAVSWPQGLDKTYQLQRNADASLTNGWTQISGSPTSDGTNYNVTIPKGSARQEYYRLKATN